MIFDVEFAVESIPGILSALPVTLYLALIGLVCSVFIGLFVALARMYRIPVLSKLASGYLLVIRGVPLMVQLYFVFVALPIWLQDIVDQLGWDMIVDLSPIVVASVALVLNYGAYMSEVIRSALLSVDYGQLEAAHSIGMSTPMAMVRIIIPQAVVVALPNLGNTIIGMVKDTSLAYMVMVVDIMGAAKKIAGSGLNYLETYAVAALIYWALNIILEKVFSILEKKANHFNVKTVPSAKA
ncbi:MAG: putative amino acid transporter, permease protein [Oscillospiraceae bacterium]|nr:putative amino acid transporter, permease protein [Oscillospiraceae bacterium]